MKSVIVLIVLLCSVSVYAGVKPAKFDSRATSTEINGYIDAIVNEIKYLIMTYGLSPMELPDLVRDFNYTDGFVNWRGNASLTNGWLEGLLNLYRDGDVTLIQDAFNMYFAGRFTISNMQMLYDFVAEVMDLGPVGQASCSITDTSFDFQFHTNIRTSESNLTYFEVFSDGQIHCEIRGLGVGMEFLTETFVNLFLRVYHDTIIFIVSDTIEALLREALGNVGGFTTVAPVELSTHHVPMWKP